MLISESYRETNRRMHDLHPGYGCGGWRWVGVALKFARDYECQSILDYGSGKGTFEAWFPPIGYDVCSYDPATASTMPKPRDLVMCIDVAEHIEPDLLQGVLADIRLRTKKIAIFLISTRPAAKTLDDGRNAHLIVQSRAWWATELLKHYPRVTDMTTQHRELANNSEALFLGEV